NGIIDIGRIDHPDEAFKNSVDRILDNIVAKNSYREEIKELSLKEVDPPKYLINVDTKRIRKYFNAEKDAYYEGIKALNGRKLTKMEVQNFLLRTQSFLSFISKTLDSGTKIGNLLIYNNKSQAQDRVSISPMTIFDSE